MYTQNLSEYPQLGKISFKKLGRKIKKAIPKPLLKIARQAGAIEGGILTAGLLKPKALRIKNKKNKKLYRYAGTAAKIGAAVALVPAAIAAASSAGSASAAGSGTVLSTIGAAGKKLLTSNTHEGNLSPTAESESKFSQASMFDFGGGGISTWLLLSGVGLVAYLAFSEK
jgi:hypothetical protein